MSTRECSVDKTSDKIVDVPYSRIVVGIDYGFAVNNPKIHGGGGSVGGK